MPKFKPFELFDFNSNVNHSSLNLFLKFVYILSNAKLVVRSSMASDNASANKVYLNQLSFGRENVSFHFFYIINLINYYHVTDSALWTLAMRQNDQTEYFHFVFQRFQAKTFSVSKQELWFLIFFFSFLHWHQSRYKIIYWVLIRISFDCRGSPNVKPTRIC